MTKPPKLKPCPFCEENDQEMLLIEQLGGTIIHPAFRVVCDNCGASTCYTDRGDHIAAWNNRIPDPAVQALVEAAREVYRISERDHVAWRKLSEALAAFDKTQAKTKGE